MFALNNLLVAALIYAHIRFHAPRGATLGRAAAGAVICGLALANQHTSVLYVVVAAPAVLIVGGPKLRTTSALLVLGLAGLAGLSPYIFTVYSATVNTAKLTWGDQSTAAGFFKQKTAYEIMPSLVGSEMCIRDRCWFASASPQMTAPAAARPSVAPRGAWNRICA